MTTVTTFYTETINNKTWYHVMLKDFDNRGQLVTVSISKKEFENIITSFRLQKGQTEKTISGFRNSFF